MEGRLSDRAGQLGEGVLDSVMTWTTLGGGS